MEIRSLRGLLDEAQNGIDLARRTNVNQAESESEIHRLKQELDLTMQQLRRTQEKNREYEHQMDLFDKESKEYLS